MNLADIRRVAVLGAGTMGAGIAQVAAQSGYEVILYDVFEEAVQGATTRLAALLHRLAEKGKLTPGEADAAIARITPTTQMEALDDVQVVIEAAPERLDIKKNLFEQLDEHVPADAILASNTSTLSITQIATAVADPSRVAGMHFFNPAPLMPLVEVIAGAATSPTTMDTLVELATALGKRPVRAKDVPGFIVNRVARPFHLEALRLLEQGVADPSTIDRLVREGGGFRMGPFELQDLIGIDINFAASQSVYEGYFHAPRFRPSHRQRQQVESGNLGRKTGRGWYEYGKDEG
jgi:3-hydroxybutyryl-CoA dehydrogenase